MVDVAERATTGEGSQTAAAGGEAVIRALTPTLVVNRGAEAIEFYKRAFGAHEVMRAPAPDGNRIWHAHLTIGDSSFFLNDEFPESESGCLGPTMLGGTSVTLHLIVPNVDDAFKQAVDAGATVSMPSACRWRTCSGATATARCATPTDTSGALPRR